MPTIGINEYLDPNFLPKNEKARSENSYNKKVENTVSLFLYNKANGLNIAFTQSCLSDKTFQLRDNVGPSNRKLITQIITL